MAETNKIEMKCQWIEINEDYEEFVSLGQKHVLDDELLFSTILSRKCVGHFIMSVSVQRMENSLW